VKYTLVDVILILVYRAPVIRRTTGRRHNVAAGHRSRIEQSGHPRASARARHPAPRSPQANLPRGAGASAGHRADDAGAATCCAVQVARAASAAPSAAYPRCGQRRRRDGGRRGRASVSPARGAARSRSCEPGTRRRVLSGDRHAPVARRGRRCVRGCSRPRRNSHSAKRAAGRRPQPRGRSSLDFSNSSSLWRHLKPATGVFRGTKDKLDRVGAL
jgi:hypothetical protein